MSRAHIPPISTSGGGTLVVITEWCPREAFGRLQGVPFHYDPDLWRRPEDLERALRDAHGLVVRNQTRVTRALVAGAGSLRVVGRLGSGLDNIEVEALRERDLPVVWTPGANAEAVAEYTIAALLLLTRPLDRWAAATRAGSWDRRPGLDLAGKTLCIIGYGHVGRRVAQKARALALQVRAYDRNATPGLHDGHRFFESALQAAFGADFLTVHVPATPDTHHLVNAHLLSMLNPGAGFINTSRGSVVDETALCQALDQNLAGAVLDVRQVEPPAPDDPLLMHPRVRHTPHVAGLTRESSIQIAVRVLSGVAAVLAGKRA